MNSQKSIEQLVAKRCQACEGGVAKFTRDEAVEQLKVLGEIWMLSDDGLMISRKFKLKNFVEAMQLANKIDRKPSTREWTAWMACRL